MNWLLMASNVQRESNGQFPWEGKSITALKSVIWAVVGGVSWLWNSTVSLLEIETVPSYHSAKRNHLDNIVRAITLGSRILGWIPNTTIKRFPQVPYQDSRTRLPRHNLKTPCPISVIYSLWYCWPQKDLWHQSMIFYTCINSAESVCRELHKCHNPHIN
jgi:hypothetical protein